MFFFSFALSVTGTYRLRFLAGKTEGAEFLLVGRHSSMHITCADDSSTAITWAAPRNKMSETSLHKKISKKKSSPCIVGMVQCMNALADEVHKQEVPCTQ